MIVTRLFLLLIGVTVFGLGVWSIVRPQDLASSLSISSVPSYVLTDFRVNYGAIHALFGGGLIYMALYALHKALSILLISAGVIIGVRQIGAWVDASGSELFWILFIEWAVFICTLILFLIERRRQI